MSIPMLGKMSSLNVSVAAGVMLYEIVRQRRNGSGGVGRKHEGFFVGARFHCLLWVWCIPPGCASIARPSLLRNTIWSVRLEPEQQRLGSARQDHTAQRFASPQKNISLQISSTLNWRSIQLVDKGSFSSLLSPTPPTSITRASFRKPSSRCAGRIPPGIRRTRSRL